MSRGPNRLELVEWTKRLERFDTGEQMVAQFCAAEGASLPSFCFHQSSTRPDETDAFSERRFLAVLSRKIGNCHTTNFGVNDLPHAANVTLTTQANYAWILATSTTRASLPRSSPANSVITSLSKRSKRLVALE